MKKSVVMIVLVTALASPAAAATVSYTYDAAGRVTRVDYGNGKAYVYTYDRNGNLVRRTAVVDAQPGRRRAVRH